MTQAKTQYQYVWMSMDDGCMLSNEGTWSLVIHHKNNIWPKSRPNTIMCDWVWMMDVCFHMMVHGHWAVTIKTTYDPSQDPIPICGWWMYAVIWRYMVIYHKNNLWPKPIPNTNRNPVFAKSSTLFWPIMSHCWFGFWVWGETMVPNGPLDF